MSIIEHVVVFRVKPDAAPSEVDSMVERVNSLVSLEEPLHLSMGSIARVQSSPTSSFNFTHILHIRFSSKEDLNAYAVHPTHVAAVKANSPIVADTMALDWVAAEEEAQGGALVPPPGSAVRVTFFKLKEGLGDEVTDEVMRVIKGLQGELKLKQSTIQFTSGENFSPGRAKGFSFASLAVFPGLAELEVVDSDGEVGKYHENDKIKDHLDCVLVLDFVVPSPKVE
ncbi:stress-response A/B barrel domain-containing protein DABB1-like [Lotus japonicus]|uniref:stress-response A/B barrel domain-containing protein DABB1-like n=1 Tax=Lotus japonicus TaxID=34305 RepID=UPI002586CBC8|nr:stress-response A/B barrel domain-containing protein DABB1-like [Lotus japonicus]